MTTVPLHRPASRTTLLALTLGHACADLCSGALFALIPFLVAERHYSYAAAGVFALVASVASAVFQPLIGAQGDRGESQWLLSTGLLVTGVAMAAVGFAASYPLTLLAVAVCTAGVATYHPEGARWARHAAGARVTADMSVFSVGGGVGYALSPLVVAVVLGELGLHGTVAVGLIPIAGAFVVAAAVRRFREEPSRPHPHGSIDRPLRSEWRPFGLLLALFCLASGVTTGLLTYVPLFVMEARHATPAASNVMTFVLLAAAACGTLLGGVAAARYGRRRVLVLPQLVLVPAIALLPSLGYLAMIPLVGLIGVAMNANVSIALVLAQEYLPRRMGLATGLTVGLCGGVGGLIVAALGWLGDAAGLSCVLYVVAALPLLCALVAARLPRPAAAPPGTLWSVRLEAE